MTRTTCDHCGVDNLTVFNYKIYSSSAQEIVLGFDLCDNCWAVYLETTNAFIGRVAKVIDQGGVIEQATDF